MHLGHVGGEVSARSSSHSSRSRSAAAAVLATVAIAAIASLTALALPTAARAQYTYIDLGTAPSAYSTNVSVNGSGGGAVAGNGSTSNFSATHALLWTSADGGTAIDLYPGTGFTYTFANGTDGTSIVGDGSGSATSNFTHALAWTSASADSAVDLNPSLLGSNASSQANGMAGTYIVGYGNGGATSGSTHALVWTSASADSAVDLNPSTLLGSNENSFANGTDGTSIVGYGYGSATSNYMHALAWTSASADSAVDLNPSLLGSNASSQADGMAGTYIVGYGNGGATSGSTHALVWTSASADSAIDLNSSALLGSNGNSYAYSTNGTSIVGYGYGSVTSNKSHALLWTSASADSAIDLSSYFTEYAFTYSYATDIDEFGDITGYGRTSDGTTHAFELKSTGAAAPEPGSLGLLALGGVSVLGGGSRTVSRRRKRTA